MIYYKLAKQLKDAGFPLIELVMDVGDKQFDFCVKCGQPYLVIDDKIYLEPNLNILIEACGEDLSHLKQLPYNEKEEGRWWAVCHTQEINGNNPEECGKTPEEAVAKLWLKLNI